MQVAHEVSEPQLPPEFSGALALDGPGDINRWSGPGHTPTGSHQQNVSGGDKINESEAPAPPLYATTETSPCESSERRHSGVGTNRNENNNNINNNNNNIHSIQSKQEGGSSSTLPMTAICVNDNKPHPASWAHAGTTMANPRSRRQNDWQAPESVIFEPQARSRPVFGDQQASSRACGPQRKRSVFSFDGFPSVQLLEQQNVNKQPVAPTNKPQPMEVDTEANQERQPPGHNKTRRSTRSDTLGSTGSSRASSCDEPTIVSGAPARFSARPTISAVNQHQRPLEVSPDCLLDRKHSSNSTMNNSSSSCSLESLAGPLCSHSPTGNKSFSSGNAEASGTSANLSESSSINARKPPIPSAARSSPEASQATIARSIAPFESIKTQLKRNSIPDAQHVARHIDKLISQNEAIVDNCNLVSIRSYNTSRPLANPTGPVSSTTSLEPPGAIRSEAALVSAGSRINKRWSTSGAPVSSDLLRVEPHTKLSSHGHCDSLSVNYFAHNKQSRHPERKRSYNLGGNISLGTAKRIDGLLIPNHGHLLLPGSNQQQLYESEQALPAGVNNSNRQSLLAAHGRCLSQDPLQLESGIQNLSLKRREDEVAEQPTFFAPRDNNSKLAEGHITATVNNQQQKQPNLMLNQEQDDILMTAILMESQRQFQTMANLESRQQAAVAILHQQQKQQQQQQQQQQMIEQQIKWNQQLASLNHHHHHHHHQQQQQQQQQLTVGAGATSGAAMLALATAASNQRQIQLANYSLRDQQAFESQMLKDFLSRMMPKQSEPRELARLPEAGKLCTHGREMLTQSLDNSIPTHRCDACDISFWTRDLLEYHILTQCVARSRDQLAKHPIAFSFAVQPPTEPVGSRLSLSNPSANSNIATTSDLFSSVSVLTSSNLAAESHYHPLVSKSVSPPRRAKGSASGTSNQDTSRPQQIAEQQQQQQQQESMLENKTSILKQQLLTTPIQVPLPGQLSHETLPFKKRKISEPNMRY